MAGKGRARASITRNIAVRSAFGTADERAVGEAQDDLAAPEWCAVRAHLDFVATAGERLDDFGGEGAFHHEFFA